MAKAAGAVSPYTSVYIDAGQVCLRAGQPGEQTANQYKCGDMRIISLEPTRVSIAGMVFTLKSLNQAR